MRRAIQSIVSRQSFLALAQSSSMIYLANPYVCVNCRRYLLGEELGSAAVGGGKVKRVHQQQQQRGIHVTARNLRGRGKKKEINWDELQGFRGAEKDQPGIDGKPSEDGDDDGREYASGTGWRRLRRVNLTSEQQRLINKRTSSFAHLRDESNLGSPDSLGTKLVDNPSFAASTKLWRTLLDFKRRLYHDPGVRDVWLGMQLRKIDLPVEGSGADLIWEIFLKSALRDEAFLGEIWEYIQNLDTRLGDRSNWRGMYDTIVGHFLINDPDPATARSWHYRLYPRHTSRSWGKLFITILRERPDAHIQLREIHATVKRPAGAYAIMIPALCTMGLHAEAVRWHRHLLSFDDLPKDTSVANDLIKWTAKYGSIQELHQLLYSFVEVGVKAVESSLISVMVSRPDKLEALRFILARSNEMDRAAMGDKFWASVVSQVNIKREVIYRYLETFGTGLVVGRETLEAVMKRFELPEDKSVWILAEIGMKFQEAPSLQPSEELPPTPRSQRPKFGRRRLDTMDDLSSALGEFLAAKNWAMFDMAAGFSIPGTPDVKIHNLLLQSDLYRGRFREALQRVEHMRVSSVAVSTPSLHLLINNLLSPRRRGHNLSVRPGYVEDDVFLVIGLLFSLLRSGTTEVDPTLWCEIFKRLGMARRLKDLEALACGLVEWYHPTRSISTRTRLVRSTIAPSTVVSQIYMEEDDLPPLSALPSRPAEIPQRSRENPLRKLFPKQLIAAIVAWGFLTFRPYSPKMTPLVRPPPPPEVRKLPKRFGELAGCVSNFTWGIKLVRKLQRLGVFVDSRVVVRAVRVRLAPVFNRSQYLITQKRVNRLAAAMMNYLTLEETVDLVERAWGEKLYKRKGWKMREKKIGVSEEDEGQKVEGDWIRKAAMRMEVLGVSEPEVKMLRRWRVEGRRKKRNLRR